MSVSRRTSFALPSLPPPFRVRLVGEDRFPFFVPLFLRKPPERSSFRVKVDRSEHDVTSCRAMLPLPFPVPSNLCFITNELYQRRVVLSYLQHARVDTTHRSLYAPVYCATSVNLEKTELDISDCREYDACGNVGQMHNHSRELQGRQLQLVEMSHLLLPWRYIILFRHGQRWRVWAPHIMQADVEISPLLSFKFHPHLRALCV